MRIKDSRGVRFFDKSADLASKMKQGRDRSKGHIENLMDDKQVTPDDYAQDRIRYVSEDASEEALHIAKDSARKTYDESKDLARRIKQKKRNADSIKQTAKSTGRQTFKEADKGIKTAERSARKEVKAAEKATKAAIKTSKEAAKTAKRAENARKKAQASAMAAKRSAEAARKAAVAAKQTAKAIAKAAEKTSEEIAAAFKSLAAAIGTGGAVAVVIILVVVIVALIVGSCFGIFYTFENDSDDGGISMKTAIDMIDQEYHQRINEMRDSEPYDILEIHNGDIIWRDVLSVYAAKTMMDPVDAGNASLNDRMVDELKRIFWDMHVISKATETKEEKTVLEKIGDNRSIISTEIEETRTHLIITVSHKTPDEMASKYGFNINQKALLADLLDDKKAAQWTLLLYYYPPGNEKLASTARSQIGQKDGQLYWSWCGFAGEVKWDGCFVSWCAGECGYIDSGVIPKYADCQNILDWFSDRGQLKGKGYIPQTGDTVFFDRADNGLTGEADQVGIVEKVIDNGVYVIIGDYKGECVEKLYNLDHSELLGFGAPAF